MDGRTNGRTNVFDVEVCSAVSSGAFDVEARTAISSDVFDVEARTAMGRAVYNVEARTATGRASRSTMVDHVQDVRTSRRPAVAVSPKAEAKGLGPGTVRIVRGARI